jgi:hypothetical protein
MAGLGLPSSGLAVPENAICVVSHAEKKREIAS